MIHGRGRVSNQGEEPVVILRAHARDLVPILPGLRDLSVESSDMLLKEHLL